MTELTSMRRLRWEMRKKQFVEEATKKAMQVSNYIRQNQDMIKMVLPVAAVGLTGAKRMVCSMIRKSTVKKDIQDRKTRFYDHSLGCYWYTKRALTADELRSVQKRKRAGESYGDIFASMKLLK